MICRTRFLSLSHQWLFAPGGAPNKNAALQATQGQDAAIPLSAQDAVQKEFEVKFEAWKTYYPRPEIRLQSNTNHDTENESYRAMIAMKKSAFPFLIEKSKAGEFLLNKAVAKIVDIDIAPPGIFDLNEFKPGDRPISSQQIAKRWGAWWKETGNTPE